MRTVKIVAGLVAGIVALFIAGLLAVWLLVNPNDYKGRITAAVKQATGRELVLAGDIKLSVFPWVALGLGPASLGNPPGFETEPSFLAFQHAAVRVRLFPLLSRRLVIDRVVLDGMELRLVKNAQGVGNWQNFGKSTQPSAGAERGSGGQWAALAGIAVTKGRVSYQGMVVENFNLETGAFGGSGVTPVSISFDATRGMAGESVTLNGRFDLSGELQKKRVKLEAVNFNGLLSQPGDGPPAHWELHAPSVDVDLTAQTAAVPAFDAGYSSAHVSGTLEATKIIDDLSVTGSVSLAPVVLREFAPRLGVAIPKTRDAKVFQQFSAGSDFSYGASGVQFAKMQITLDDTHLKGSVAIGGEPRAVKFALTVDEMDVSRYLPPDSGSAQTPAVKTGAAGAAPGGEAAASKLPAAQGTLTVASLHLAPLEFSNVRLTLASKEGVAHLFPAQAQIDGGSYSGDITVDAHGAVPALSMDEHLSGVDMAQLLVGTAYKGHVSGRGNVNVKATARGAALDAVMQTLNGHFEANLANGALEGVDLGYVIGQAQALMHHGAAPAESKPPRTKFDALKMSAEIINGVAKTTDMVVSSPVLKVTGQGSANLITKGIDFRMLASVLKAPGTSVAEIPVKVGGTYTDPTIRPDVEALAKGQIKDTLMELLKKNGLEGLFGK